MKPIEVYKFGGTSVGSIERIQCVAQKVAKFSEKVSPVVVVSAMSGETNRLVDLFKQIGGAQPSELEYHQIVSSGEVVSSALVSIALNKLGVKAKPMLANRLGMVTSNCYGTELISAFDPIELKAALDEGYIPVVAGFQGVNDEGEVTTLGRGGSDTTAVAVSVALGSVPCKIYTDVTGVFTANPSVVKSAKKLDVLSYEEMLELASGGAKVLHTRCVSLARKFKVPLEVRSTFDDVDGTSICEEYNDMENSFVSGISHRPDEVKVTFSNLPDEPGIAARIFEKIAAAGIIVDMIVQSASKEGIAQISFTISSEDLEAVNEVGTGLAKSVAGLELVVQRDISKISVVGEGMKAHAGIAAQMFEVLGKEGINIDMITTSEIKISVAVESKYCELALRVLHDQFIDKVATSTS